MSAAIVRKLALARAVANLAAEYGPDCPSESSRLLVSAAWIFRCNGADAAADHCQRTAEELRRTVRQPRSRPFVPEARPL